MADPNATLLYVASPLASADFDAELLGKLPVESSPGFALFGLDGGSKLGLWAAGDVQPPANPPGGSELAFSVADDETVSRMHRDGSALGVGMIQPPTRMDFGFTFVAVDPDGHRLRVYAAGEG